MTFPDLLQFVNTYDLVKPCFVWYIYYMKDIWNYLRNSKKPVVLYGMGNGADKIISVCDRYGIKISGVFSSDAFVRRKTFHGMPVTNYKTAKENFGEMVVLLCFGTALPEVIGNIKHIMRENELYAPDVPVCGGDLFCAEYYEQRKPEFDAVFNMLADDISKETFRSVVEYKLTGNIDYLFGCETDADEPYANFLRLGDNETYLDLGAYRGDTVQSFAKRVEAWERIIAVEPDSKTFEKLKAFTADIKNIEYVNAFVCDRVGVAGFNMNGSRGSAGGNGGSVNAVTVDSLAVCPTFIKMDIEGAESAAISGAATTISACRPKMQIAAYHRSGDLTDIPKAVLSIRNDYKIYLRHNPCLPAWDINYFFI